MVKRSSIVMALLLATASVVIGGRRNLMPDAVTRATTWNSSEGDIQALWDGEHPGNNASPKAFSWESKGILVIEFPEPVELSEFRAYMGEKSGSHTLSLYLGGRTKDDGGGRDPEGELMLVLDTPSFVTDGWMSLPLIEGIPIDNLELVTFGRSTFYEIELLGPEGTSIERATWGMIKSRR